MVILPTNTPYTMDWYAKSQVQAFPKFRATAEYWIATKKIPEDIRFNMIIMILGKEGDT